MNDELKSAVDLALEKLDRQKEMSVSKLSEDQKSRIAEIRRKYQAKIAETEISAQSATKKAWQTGDPGAAEETRKNLSSEKIRLQEKMDREIEAVRSESKS